MLEITRAELEELFISIGMPKSRVSEESDAKLLGRIHLLPEKIESGQLPKNPDGKQLDFIQRVCTAIKDGNLKIVHQKSTVTRVFVPVKDGVDLFGFKENSVGFRVNQVLTDKPQTLTLIAEKAETKLANARIHLKKLVDSGKVLHDNEKGYCLPKRRGRPNIKKTESEEMKTKKESKKTKPKDKKETKVKAKKETKPAKTKMESKDSLPRNKYYDVSKWNPYNSAAVSAAKKMSRMEESAKTKDIELVKAHLPKTKMDSSMNTYAKTVFRVYETICRELGKKCILPERFRVVKEENEVKTKMESKKTKPKDKKETKTEKKVKDKVKPKDKKETKAEKKVKAKKETKPAKTKVKTETKEKKTKKKQKV